MVLCFIADVVYVQGESKDLDLEEGGDNEDLARRHRKRKKHQYNNNNNGGPCGGGTGGYGRTFGDKLFGYPQSTTYVSAPVMNYYFGCGSGFPSAPIAAVAPHVQPGFGGGGGGHHHHHHNHHNQGGSGYPSFNQRPINVAPLQDQAVYSQQRPERPLVAAASSGLGSALINYLSGRPRKAYKQFNRSVNQFFRPFYRLF